MALLRKARLLTLRTDGDGCNQPLLSSINACAEAIMEHVVNDDAAGVKETIAELDDFEIERVKELLTPETVDKISLIEKGN